LLGAVAAALGAEVLTAVTAIAEDAGRLTVTRLAHTGITEVTSRHDGPVAVALPGGRAPAPTPGRPGAPIQEVSLTPAAITLEELTVTGQERRDITGAQRLVAVGRGLRAKEDLPMVERLAGVLRAQLACSRPLAEGLGWFDRDQYVGGSGQHVAPQLYLALGISGQLHHVVGCRGSQVLVAVNSDPQAPIFDEADYGVVADLYQIVPELTRALS
jgi:electron transfer flavoprotein alpha subunit